jgi:hypothetical protein
MGDTGDFPAKSMKGKYDGRRLNGRSRTGNKPGRKPEWAKHLTKNTAATVLKQCNATERWTQLLDQPDKRLQFEVLRYSTDRLEGRPFIALNPEERAKPSLHDNRLQLAIQNLILPAIEKNKAKRIAKPVEEPKALPEPKADLVN